MANHIHQINLFIQTQKNKTMKTYFEAYSERMERVDKMLKGLALNFIDRGCTIYKPKGDRLIKFISVFHENGNHLTIGFAEVPYRWYASISFKPSKENGSGRTLKEWDNVETLPDTDVFIRLMQQYYLPTDTESLDKHLFYMERITVPLFQLKHKGEHIFTGTENACYFKLQRTQSQSADWAMKHEGYTITPLSN